MRQYFLMDAVDALILSEHSGNRRQTTTVSIIFRALPFLAQLPRAALLWI